MRQWHLVKVAQARDATAVERLVRHGFDPYQPMERIWRPVRKSRMSKRERQLGVLRMEPHLRPMFSRYLFCRLDAAEEWRDIFLIAGVCGLTVCNGLPAPIDDALIDHLRSLEVDGAIAGDTPAGEVFHVGERVRVAHGPLSGRHGRIEKIRTCAIEGIDFQTRLVVVMEMFGGAARVELDHRTLATA